MIGYKNGLAACIGAAIGIIMSIGADQINKKPKPLGLGDCLIVNTQSNPVLVKVISVSPYNFKIVDLNKVVSITSFKDVLPKDVIRTGCFDLFGDK